MSASQTIASILLDEGIDKPLDYEIPENLLEKVCVGMRVLAPVRGSPKRGTVIALKEKAEVATVQKILELLSEKPLLSDTLFALAHWMANYYCTPLRKVLKVMLPPGIRKNIQKKVQLLVSAKLSRPEMADLCQKLREKKPEQARVLDTLLLHPKGVLLSELIEKAQISQSPIKTLIKQNILHAEPLSGENSPIDAQEVIPTKHKTLREEQAEAFAKIQKSLDQGEFATHLLHGVTGSGKTEIYLQALDYTLRQGKGVILLVPEILLASQTLDTVRARFAEHVILLHHRLSDGERHESWKRIHAGEVRIVMGARSALFSPMPNLGLIILDEEHESAYKHQDEQPAYHARDVALMRAKLEKATVILGSATPSLESYQNALQNKFQLSTLKKRSEEIYRNNLKNWIYDKEALRNFHPERETIVREQGSSEDGNFEVKPTPSETNSSSYFGIGLPPVKVIDMRAEFAKAKGFTLFSDPLLAGIRERRDRGEQTILLLNRRGYNTSCLCTGCGNLVRCPHCDLALTYHMGEEILSCHLCSYRLVKLRSCPQCHAEKTLKYKGAGTEMVERALHAIFPEVRTLRLDADTTRHKGSHEQIFRAFRSAKADVLIGTQMVAKGLHFPAVTLVGVLHADSSLNIPDFRAAEKSFQLLTQVAGRSGRAELSGEVIIQTNMPDHTILKLAAAQDYAAFFHEEIEVRKLFNFPPFCHLAKLVFSGEKQHEVEKSALAIRAALIEELPPSFEILPVIPCGHAKVKDKFRYQFLIKGSKPTLLSQKLSLVQKKVPLRRSVRLLIDIDPETTFF